MIDIPIDIPVKVCRSFSRRGVFCSATADAPNSAIEAVSESLFKFCWDQVEDDIASWIDGEQIPDPVPPHDIQPRINNGGGVPRSVTVRSTTDGDTRQAAPPMNPLVVEHLAVLASHPAFPQHFPSIPPHAGTAEFPAIPLVSLAVTDQSKMLNDVSAKLAKSKGIELAAAKAYVVKFLSGFVSGDSDVKNAPKAPSKDLDAPCMLLPALVKDWPGKMIEAPFKLGVGARVGWDKLKSGLLGPDLWWPYAAHAAAAQYPDDPAQVLEFMETVKSASESDMIAFLLCCKVSKSCAAALRDGYDKNLWDVVAGIDFSTVAEEALLKRIKG